MLNQWLTAWSTAPEATQWLILIGVALVVFFILLALGMLIAQFTSRTEQRISRYVNQNQSAESDLALSSAGRLMQQIGSQLTPKDEGKRARIITKLIQAGYRHEQAVRFFFAAKVIGMLSIPALLWLILELADLAQQNLTSFLSIGFLVGFLIPDFWLTRRHRQRQQALRLSLPDALDLLVVCTEAGMGLFAGIDRVGQEIELQHPELAEELMHVMRQRAAGMSSEVALNDLVNRTGLDDMRNLVSVLQSAIQFGTALSSSLRVYAEDLRDQRLQTAKELAGKLDTKMLIPIIAFIMPAFLIVAVGPAIFQVVQNLGGVLK
jgi:tight adherence protein C